MSLEASVDQFVSEPIKPDAGTFSGAQLATGLVSLPAGFVWREDRYDIVECLDHVKLTSREGATTHGDRYLRRQRFTVRLHTGQIAVLDFHRQASGKHGSRAAKQRWFLYTLSTSKE